MQINENLSKYEKTAEAAAYCTKWIETEASHIKSLNEQKDKLKTEGYRIFTRAKAASEVLEAKTTLGVFGASQAGKSYLVSRMAAGESGVLATTWDGVDIDFITHINPQGNDKEATGFVTRFTHQQNPGIKGFPIKVKVFKEIEIAMILVNSFFNDLDQDKIQFDIADEILEAHLKSCASFVDESAPNFVSPDDVVELADYAQSHSAGKLKNLDANHPFWLKARDLAPKLSVKGRAKLFSILWQDCKVFTLLYENIARELVKLEGKSFVYAPLTAFLEDDNGVLKQRKRGTIINISSLAYLFGDTEKLTVCLDEEAKKKVDLPFATFAAVSLEITFPIANNCSIENFDVLDFPGARERRRDNLQDFINDEKNFDGVEPTRYMIEQGTEFIRRGKVAYLFDRYSKRQEVDVLLFCIGVNAQQEVSSIVSILTGWIELNAGKDPKEREEYEKKNGRSPLICVLTRFDSIFSRQLKVIANGQPTDTQREMKDAIEKISAQGWMKEWLPGKPFDNFFIARKPNLPDNATWLRMENGVELGVKDDYLASINQIREELCSDPLFAKHVKDPKRAVEEVLNKDGGVNLITDLLVSKYQDSPEEREIRCTNRLRILLKKVKDVLDTYARPEGDNAVKEYESRGLEIALGLLQCNSVARIFGKLRSLMEVPKEQFVKAYEEDFAVGSNVNRFASKSMQLYFSNLNDLTSGKKLEYLTQSLLRAWNEKKRNLEYDKNAAQDYSFFYNDGQIKSEYEIKQAFSSLISKFIKEVSSLAHSSKCNLEERLIALLKADEQINSRLEALLPSQVEIASRFFSDFSSTLDLRYLDKKSQAKAYFKVKDEENNQSLKAQLVEGGEERGDLLRIKVLEDYLMPVPLLDNHTRRYEFNFLSGYLSALVYAMVNINAIAGSDGNDEEALSIESNRDLCTILKIFGDSLC